MADDAGGQNVFKRFESMATSPCRFIHRCARIRFGEIILDNANRRAPNIRNQEFANRDKAILTGFGGFAPMRRMSGHSRKVSWQKVLRSKAFHRCS